MSQLRRCVLLVLCATTVAAGTAGCSRFPASDDEAIVAVDGLTQFAGSGSSLAGALSGVVSVDDRGCWVMRAPGNGSLDVVWPAGTAWDGPDRRSVRLSNGRIVAAGSSIRAGGGVHEGVARDSRSIAPDVTCLGATTVTMVTMSDADTIAVTSAPE